MRKGKIIFLSHQISYKTPLYGGMEGIILKRAKAIKKGDSCNTMHWSFPNHTGTHVDVPLHVMKQGRSVTDFKPEDWVFNKVSVVQIPNVQPGYIIKLADLIRIKNCELLLIRTGFEKNRTKRIYWQDSPCLDPSLAPWLKKNYPAIRTVGIDFISVSNLNNRELGSKAHKAFLSNNILLVEDMKLSGLGRMPNLVIIAPLCVKEADGSPCTIFAICNKFLYEN